MTSKQIETAVDAVILRRPAYKSLLDFYGQLFIAQENSKANLRIDPVTLTLEETSERIGRDQPLIRRSEFRIDAQSALELLGRIYLIARDTHPELAEAVKVIWESVEKKQLNPGALFAALLKDDDRFFERTASTFHVDERIMAFVIYSSLNPSIFVCAQQLAGHLDPSAPWVDGHCPICGSPPAVSLLDRGDKRFMVCSFCWHSWRSPLNFCPFCHNTDSRNLHHFANAADPYQRVDVCDGCGHYIKTLDVRLSGHPVYPPLEQVSTLHLDVQAMEKGLKSGNPSYFRDIVG